MLEKSEVLNEDIENTAERIKDKYKISLETQKFILQMCWAQHDAQWFLKSKSNIGIKEANELNQKVVYSMGTIEAKHIMSALNIEKGSIKSISELNFALLPAQDK